MIVYQASQPQHGDQWSRIMFMFSKETVTFSYLGFKQIGGAKYISNYFALKYATNSREFVTSSSKGFL